MTTNIAVGLLRSSNEAQRVYDGILTVVIDCLIDIPAGSLTRMTGFGFTD